jgi:pimeloyl-ACP methyl ester carboxylesterase
MSRTPRTVPLDRRPSPHRAGVLATLCLALAATAAAPAAAGNAPTPLVFSPYAMVTKSYGTIATEEAFLEVPRRHSEPDGPRFRLRVVRLPATGGDGRAAPVVYLAGGPGGSGFGTALGPRWPVFDRVRRQTDVLLLDQRGTDFSEMPPECSHAHRFADAEPLQREAALAALRGAATECINEWRNAGVDLGAYTTAESADDIDDLRRAMGLPRISLWGMSYGTHLALATVRRHGPQLERVVLMGTEGPDDTIKLPLAADTLLADLSTVARKDGFDDLQGAARRVLASLRQHPVQASSPLHGGRTVTIGEFDAQIAIANALGRRSTQRMLPLLLREAEAGDYTLLAGFVLMMREDMGSFRAMPLAMDVASGQSPQRRALVQAQARESLFGDALNFPLPELADGLGLADLGEAFRAPLRSDVPTLFISGTLDGRTPPANAQALLPGFSKGQHLRVRGASHDNELWLGNAAIADRIADFLAGKTVSADALDVPLPVFITRKSEL